MMFCGVAGMLGSATFAGATGTYAFNNFDEHLQYNTNFPTIPAADVNAALLYQHGIRFDSLATGAVTDIRLALTHFGGGNDFTVQLHEDDEGQPGAAFGSWTNIQAVPLGAPPPHIAAGGQAHLTEGATYWFVVLGTGDSRGLWHRNIVSDAGWRAWSANGGVSWEIFPAFRWTFQIIVDEGVGECYANCDGSMMEPLLTVDDFTCFINEFAAAQGLPHEQQVEHYANCDGSTAGPVLTVDDFTCFINAFAGGCP